MAKRSSWETLPQDIKRPRNLLSELRGLAEKPTIVLSGSFDSGKTTIANSLLGGSALVSRYTPTTCIQTFVRHRDDRPRFIRDDVWILAKGLDLSRWRDEEHCFTHKLAGGGIDLLESYGTRQDSPAGSGNEESSEAQSALVFLDAPVLQACTLVDLPGYNNDEKDTNIANGAKGVGDICLYTSPAAGFFCGSDFLQFSNILQSLRPECEGGEFCKNLLIVMTRCNEEVSDADIAHIRKVGAERLIRHFADSYFQRKGLEFTADYLQTVIVPFSPSRAARRVEFRDRILHLLTVTYPVARTEKVSAAFRDAKAEMVRLTSDKWSFVKTESRQKLLFKIS